MTRPHTDLIAGLVATTLCAAAGGVFALTGEWIVDRELLMGLSAFAVAALMRQRAEQRRFAEHKAEVREALYSPPPGSPDSELSDRDSTEAL